MRTCINGEWTGTSPSCEKSLHEGLPASCPRPITIDHGYYMYKPIEESDAKDTEAKVYYECHQGYKLMGETVRTCVNAEWTGTIPRCEKSLLQCAQPKNIEYGDRSILGQNDAKYTGMVPEGSGGILFMPYGLQIS